MFVTKRNFTHVNKVSASLLALALIAGAAFYAQAKARSSGTDAQGQTFADWGVECETTPAKKKQCFISQAQIAKDTGKALLKVSVGYLGPNGEPALVAMVPLGISIPSGVAFKIDDSQEAKLVVQFCTPDGCAASAQLDNTSLEAMKNGKAMLVGMVPSVSDRKPMTIKVSLKGFKQGFDSLGNKS